MSIEDISMHTNLFNVDNYLETTAQVFAATPFDVKIPKQLYEAWSAGDYEAFENVIVITGGTDEKHKLFGYDPGMAQILKSRVRIVQSVQAESDENSDDDPWYSYAVSDITLPLRERLARKFGRIMVFGSVGGAAEIIVDNQDVLPYHGDTAIGLGLIAATMIGSAINKNKAYRKKADDVITGLESVKKSFANTAIPIPTYGYIFTDDFAASSSLNRFKDLGLVQIPYTVNNCRVYIAGIYKNLITADKHPDELWHEGLSGSLTLVNKLLTEISELEREVSLEKARTEYTQVKSGLPEQAANEALLQEKIVQLEEQLLADINMSAERHRQQYEEARIQASIATYGNLIEDAITATDAELTHECAETMRAFKDILYGVAVKVDSAQPDQVQLLHEMCTYVGGIPRLLTSNNQAKQFFLGLEHKFGETNLLPEWDEVSAKFMAASIQEK